MRLVVSSAALACLAACRPALPESSNAAESVPIEGSEGRSVGPGPDRAAQPTGEGALPAADSSHGSPAATTPADKAAARQLASAGMNKYHRGDHAGAIADFERAYALVQVPTLLLYIGRAQIKLGRKDDARRTLEQVAKWPVSPAEPQVFTSARAEAKALLQGIGP